MILALGYGQQFPDVVITEPGFKPEGLWFGLKRLNLGRFFFLQCCSHTKNIMMIFSLLSRCLAFFIGLQK